MGRKRVLQVLHTLEVGGAERVALSLAESLSKRFEFRFACLDGLGPLEDQLRELGIQADLIGRRPGFDTRAIASMRGLMRQFQPDVVHAHQTTPFVYTLAARFGQNTPILLTEHGRFHPDVRSWKRALFHRLAMRRRDMAVAVGEAVAKALVEMEGIADNRVRVVYNGIELERFAALDSARRKRARAELGIDDESFVVLTAARLDSIKDHKTALRAISEANQNGANILFLVAGEGPERSALEQEIATLELGDAVRLLGTVDDVPALLRVSDVALLSSLSEGIPLFLIEAMAASVPVVASVVGGIPEVVRDGEEGFLVPAGSPQGFASALLKLRSGEGIWQRMSAAGPRRAAAMFSIEAMAGSYADLFERMSPRAGQGA